ncbi:MAG: 4a-hydroxytetrahydrobiopterin dehydratase [Flavobacteriaceae bacterium]|nr:4a-hydroxytetrahydrobiopterin dehydratase [Flavobacteriaceae bacterium]MBL6685175.1 4a-hydroxytetrahydrobiopterin dehydratase [Flavobacteriaceae bacterium]|tara:strand:+ start:844 stop:1146 length:303 start_codon:yes stop_codon:yes gene_type:complete
MRKKLDDSQIIESLSRLTLDWVLEDGFLKKSFKFKNFDNAIKFIKKVSVKCEEINHHPKWTNIYNTIDIELNTHDINGISELDFKLSEYMNITYNEVESD